LPDSSTRQGAGIVHLGPGAFFRAFNAVFTDEVLKKHGGDWGIIGVSLRSADVRDKLIVNGFSYKSVTLAPDLETLSDIHAIKDILVAPEDPGAVFDAMIDPAIKIVSLTITEKGYCHSPATGELDFTHPDIVYDLNNPNQPRSAIGYIVSALSKRHQKGHAPFTVLSCDNLPNNGHLAKRLVLAFAAKVDPNLAAWIEQKCRFPATMVDRITPATTDADVKRIAALTGKADLGIVLHEPFRQWVIEDDFVNGQRPDWSSVGAQFVKDVARFEDMKLRCLNGAHSTLAYLGYLGGYETIAEVMAVPEYSRFIEQLWEKEIIPSVEQPEGEDLFAYGKALKARFENPKIQHCTWQIAMDGSQKLPQRLLGTIADNLLTGRSVKGLCLGVAGWLTYVGGFDETGQPIEVKDPLAEKLKTVFDSSTDLPGKVSALLKLREVFSAELATNPNFVTEVTTAFMRINTVGARAAVGDFA